ncbi:MAG: tetratricopeptide repeat protein, partial [Cytophagales bacterium]
MQDISIFTSTRFNMKSLIISLFVLMVSLSPVFAQGQWETVFQKAYSLQKKYAHKDAIPVFEEALALAEKDSGKTSERYLKTRNYLGFSKIFVEDRQQTEAFLKDNQRLIEQALTKRHSLYLYALYPLAYFYSFTQNNALAEVIYREIVVVSKETLGEQSSMYRKAAKDLGNLCRLLKKLIEAEQWLLGVLQIEKTTLGKKHLDYRATLNTLGAIYRDMGEYTKAENYYKEYAQLTKELFGEEHPEYAGSLLNLTSLYGMLGNRELTKQLCKKGMAILEANLGERTLNYSSLMDNLAIIYTMEGNYVEAKQLYEKSLEIIKELFGVQSYHYLTTYKNTADLYFQMGLYAKAEKMYQGGMTSFKNQKNTYDYYVYAENLSNLYCAVDQYDKAKELQEEVLSVRRETVGEKHPQYNISLEKMGILHSKMGNYEAAGASFIKSRELSHALIRQNFSFMSEQEKTAYFNNDIRFFIDNFTSFAIEQNKHLAEVYDTQLFTKGILLASTQKMKNRLLNSKDTVVVQKYKQWNTLKMAVGKYAQMAKEELLQKNISLDSLETESNNLEKELSLLSESFASLADAREVTWKDVQAKLKKNEAAIEIVRINHFGIQKTVTDTSDLAKAPNFPQY